MVVENAEGARRSYSVLVQISEHLLATFKAHVSEKHYTDCLGTKLRALTENLFYRRPTMLPVIYDEPSCYRNLDLSDANFDSILFYRQEFHGAINGCCQSREYVAPRIL